MSEVAGASTATGLRRVWPLITQTFARFDADGVPRLAAAMSYFLLLAVAPLLLILNAVLGVVGERLGLSTAPPIDAVGSTAASGINQAVAWAGSYAPYLAVVLVVVGGLSVFAQFVGALEVIWATPPRRTPVRGFLRYNAVALALLLVATFALLVALILSALASAFAGIALQFARDAGLQLSGIWVMLALRYAPVLVASAALFWVAFTVAPDRRIRWRDSLSGALVTSVLFLVGEVGLSLYLGSTQRFNVFGTFQFFVVLIVWIYYSALVALWGAELTRLMILGAEYRREAASVGPQAEPASG
jgi:membrane protein